MKRLVINSQADLLGFLAKHSSSASLFNALNNLTQLERNVLNSGIDKYGSEIIKQRRGLQFGQN